MHQAGLGLPAGETQDCCRVSGHNYKDCVALVLGWGPGGFSMAGRVGINH